jgi:riboflavin kinase/FMN adenylyltransferase
MKVYRNFDEIDFEGGTVVTVGTFDGVHKGHQLIIKRLLEISGKENLTGVVLTIDPHPQLVLKKEGKSPIKILTVISERIKLFEKFGLEHLFIIPFSYEFSRTAPDVFVREYLHEKFNFKKILIGHDHLFGRNREGSSDLLDKMSTELGFGLELIEPFTDNGILVSSTIIRNALANRELDTANEMLGYEYFVDGEVEHGSGRGEQLGYPTANIKIPDPSKQLPANGIYLVSSVIDGKKYFGMANLGTRPTFSDDEIVLLEVNFLNFDYDIYGKPLSVSFLKFIREEKKFSSAEELVKQMDNDKEISEFLIKRFYY